MTDAPREVTLVGPNKAEISKLCAYYLRELEDMGPTPDGRRIVLKEEPNVDYSTASAFAEHVVIVLPEDVNFAHELQDINQRLRLSGAEPGKVCIVVMYFDGERCIRDSCSPAVVAALGDPAGNARGPVPVFSQIIHPGKSSNGDASDAFAYFLFPNSCFTSSC